jgi:hypothetical protein
MSTCTILRCTVAFIAALFFSAAAHAQLFRAYLASDGNDANPCTLAAPCRLLPAALTAVASGGEIWMLDSANYNSGPVLITKSVTILAVPGALGSVVANGGNAININNSVEVALRNLVIVPLTGGGGTSGISLTANGAELTVENCLIANLPGYGIAGSNLVTLRVTDSTIRGNGVNGVLVQGGARISVTRATISGNAGAGLVVYGSGANTMIADITSSTLEGNSNSGLVVQSVTASSVVKVSIRDSLIAGNSTGVFVQSGAGASVTVSASNNTISNNSDGIVSMGSGAKVWASANTVSDNSFNGLNNISGLFESAGNNAVRNNTTNKAGTITVVAME